MIDLQDFVELQGIEPWSKHIRRKLSTCLFAHWLQGNGRSATNQLFPQMNGLKQWSHHSITASSFVFESAAEHGNRRTCSAALMVVNLSIKQPWHTVYCHLRFSHSDLSANYATHYMLILTKNYAVKTGQPRVVEFI